MAELRKDPITGQWVILSPERAGRPTDFADEPAGRFPRSAECPFCPGHEAMTPPEVFAVPMRGKGKGWQIRVVPNKFPAVEPTGAVGPHGEGLFERLDGVGIHEVIIENPDHGATLATLPEPAVEEVLRAYQSRFRAIEKDGRFPYVVIFKNHGPEAGATLEHGHSQLVALPVKPARLRSEVEGAHAYFSRWKRCVYCDMIREEDGGARFVTGNDDFIVVAPFASRFSWEVWVLPRQHRARFAETSEPELSSLARILKATLASVDQALDSPPYNLIVQSAPFGDGSDEHYHWHLEIAPRLTKLAGFEWATGTYINPVSPEEAARKLREVTHLDTPGGP